MKSKFWMPFLFLVLLSFFILGCATGSVTEEEKALLITIDDIAKTGVPVGRTSEAGEKYAARRYVNDLTEVDYEYDSENDPVNSALVVFFSEADTYRNEDLAIEGFFDTIEAYGLGAKIGTNDIDVIEIPNHFLLGEQNYSAFLEVDGIRFGNIVVTRKGRLVYSLLLAGPYIKTSQTLHYLIGPKLEMVAE